LEHYSVAIPIDQYPHKRILIYKEAARDQAQIPAGNPSILKKVPIPAPVNIPGNINLQI
jgi:hypothetical protein